MNKVFTSTVLALSMISTAMAQNPSMTSQPQDPNEVIVLSSYIDGNYNVERLLVMESSPNNNEFVVHYKINLTKLISTYDNNSKEIAGLKSFIESVQSDSLKRITHFDVVGYASPDGPSALNKRLASARANDFEEFIDSECGMADYSRTVSSEPYLWVDTEDAIQRSSVPNKPEVISLVESSNSQSEIQSKLEAHVGSWDYIKANILPPMRSVELHVKYNSWKVVENRTLIEEIVPEEITMVVTDGAGGGSQGDQRNGGECCEDVVDDYIYCTLVEIPGNAIDYVEAKPIHAKFKTTRRGAKYKARAGDMSEKVKEHEKRWWRR